MNVQSTNKENSLWVEKYRPNKVKDIILPKSIKNTLQGFVDKQEIPNLIFAGKPGTSKTTSALALAHQLNLDTMMINASLENGIDVLRTRIASFCSSVSLTGNMKCVILDESDYLSNAAQPGFRAFIEKFSKNTRFIFTCNYSNRILDPIKSRCTVIDFDFPSNEKQDLIKQTIARVVGICNNESVKFDIKAIAKIVIGRYPDFRKIINTVQTASINGEVTLETINDTVDDYHKLVKALKEKNFKEMREWVATNKDNVADKIYSYFYENANKIFKCESIPQMVITSAEYQYKSAFANDQEINTAAYLTELMVNCEFL